MRRHQNLTIAAVGAVTALLVGTTPALAASVADPGSVCPPPSGGNASFDDVPQGGAFTDVIECLVDYGVAQGYDDGTYHPGQQVNRAQMAAFITNLIETAQPGTLDLGASYSFDDVPASSVFAGPISALAAAGIVSGTGDGSTYSPGAPVNRAQMATFVHNAIEAITGHSLVDAENPDDATNGNDDTAAFDDVSPNSVFGPMIDALAAEGIVSGVGDGTSYGPSGTVTRAQMAAFVMRSAAFADSVGRWSPTVETNQSYDVTSPVAGETTNLVSGAAPNEDRGARTYSVTGLQAGGPYTVTLFPPDQITDDGGMVTFADLPSRDSFSGPDRADNMCDSQQFDDPPGVAGGGGAVIEQINGAALPDGPAKCVFEVSPDGSGTITFVVDSQDPDAAQPVVFLENFGHPELLDLDASDAPVEPFGVGAITRWTAAS